LKELGAKGFIECIQNQKSPMVVRWTLTEKGRDTAPMLIQFIAFSSKSYADVVFNDKKPRKLHELFDLQAIELIQKYF
jgi:DNA-binding HxlR family transcriptional regulator